MNKKLIKEHLLSIVLVGDFNPKIFQPEWFYKIGLIREDEASNPIDLISHAEIMSFNLGWIKVEINRQKFTVYTEQSAYFDLARDFTIGTFKILKHTPIKMLGINNHIHVGIYDKQSWNSFADKVAPDSLLKKGLPKGELEQLTIKEERSNPKGYTRLTVQPSLTHFPGAYFDINNHFEIDQNSKELGCKEIISILENNWKETEDKTLNILSNIWDNK